MPDTNTLLSQFYLTIDGADAPHDLMGDLVEVSVETSLHLPDVATLTLHDPRLRWVDDNRLAPGTAITVAAKAGHGEKPLFDGEIVEIEPDFGPSTQRLVVRAFDRLHRLNRGRYVRSFLNVTDGDLVSKIAQEVGLKTEVGPTSQVHPYVFQANETNLAFLQRRAASLGYLLFVQGKTLHCAAPLSNGQTIELKWGETLSDFRPRLTTIGQLNDVTVRGWDPANRRAAATACRRSARRAAAVRSPKAHFISKRTTSWPTARCATRRWPTGWHRPPPTATPAASSRPRAPAAATRRSSPAYRSRSARWASASAAVIS